MTTSSMQSSPAVSEQTGANPESDAAQATGPGENEQGERGAPAARDLTAELAALEDRYKRALADLDNYRKRSRRDVERRAYEQREAVLRDWLEVADSIERAITMAPDPDNPLYQGLTAVLDQIEEVMRRQGVRRVGAAGEPFDPERHEAVAVDRTADLPNRTVVELVRPGYALGDRILRPAQVIVAQPREAAS
jgi:molecular chaperone GrpE